MSDLGKRIANLTPEQRALLEERLLKTLGTGPKQSIPRRTSSAPCRLSFGQQWLWLLHQLAPDSVGCNEPSALRMRGPLDVASLKRALDEIRRRHEVLRTTFSAVDGKAVQIASPPAPCDLKEFDIAAVPAANREDEARRLVMEEAWAPFNLATGPVTRARLIKLAKDDHILVTVTHHVATDGWSSGVFLRELSALYNAYSRGEQSPLADLPVQYADYAEWLLDRVNGPAAAADVSYWVERLTHAPSLELLPDHPRPAVQTFRGSRHVITIETGEVTRLEAFARSQRATLFMVLAATYRLLLGRRTGQKDIVIGTPVSGRSRVETEGLIGLFVNLVALRTDMSGNPTFRELVARERETALGAFEHQEVPFEKLVERLVPNHDLSRPPLVQAVFVYMDSRLSELKLNGLAAEPFPFESRAAKFELVLFAGKHGDKIQLTFEYNSDLFEHATIERMAEHFRELLLAGLDSPDMPVGRLPMVTPSERRTIAEWTSSPAGYPRDKCVHQVFSERAAAAGDAVALVFDGNTMTYGELDRRSNQLARHLRTNGVGRETPVVTFMERSSDFPVALLGILKAGGVYAPIDPGYPAERVSLMLEDTQAGMIITQDRLVSSLPPHEARVLRIDADWPTVSRQDTSCPPNVTSADAAACLIYTSGSTGRPKGARIPHRGITRLVLNTDYLHVDESDTVAQASAVSFDAATIEIYGALLNGARLVGVGADIPLETESMEAFLRDNNVSVMFLTTSVFNMFARKSPGIFASMKNLMYGGEAADVACTRTVLRSNPPKYLLNCYGPTEVSSLSTWFDTRRLADDAPSVPIGRPITNTSIYILDEFLQPQPIGVVGEIFIGGPGVALGYLNRPELTAERLIPDPFSDAPGAMMYRSGDLGRWLAGGDVEFLGRGDDQIKIRGFRIELGEIEAVLSGHPEVGEPAVVTRIDQMGEKRLVAFIAPRGGSRPKARDLKAYLESRMPDFMVPSAFVVLDSLPHTTSGKIDRRALPEVEWQPTQGASDFVEPRTPAEDALARIWARTLRLEKVGITDNFFDLGGHSILAVELFAEIEKVFGRKMPLTTLFAAPTVEQLAVEMAKAGQSDVLPPVVTFEKGNGGVPLFAVATADAFVFADLARDLGPGQAFYGLHPQGIIPASRPVIDIPALAARYVEEMRKVQPRGPYRVAGICAAGIIAYEIAQQLTALGQTVDTVALIDTAGPFSEITRMIINMRRLGKVADHMLTHFANIRNLPARERGPYVKDNLRRIWRRLTGRQEQAGPRRRAPVGRAYWMVYNGAYLAAMARYRPKPYPGRVILFVAGQGATESFARERLFWGKLARGGADVHVVPGTHAEMLHEPQAGVIATGLRRYLSTNPG